MEKIRHIHEVLQILFTSEKVYTVESLYTELNTQYGEDVHFTNCAENVFPIDEVIPFLLSREKIRLEENRIIPLTPACSH
jgi:probable metal-binding protein